MPDFSQVTDLLNAVFLGNSLKIWIISLSIILSSVTFCTFLSKMIKKIGLRLTRGTENTYDDILFDIIQKPLSFLVVFLGLNLGLSFLILPESVLKLKSAAFFILLTLNIAWILDQSFKAIIEKVIKPLVLKSESTLDDQLLPLFTKLFSYLIWSIAVIIGLDNAGYDAGAILAGLGIGGLAFALAAQDSVSNIFGGLTIFIDKPFMINDRIEMEGIDGVVKEIGIRSTKITQLDGRVVTVPNSKFTDNSIKNISSEPSRKVSIGLGLTYDMSSAQIEEAIALLRTIISEEGRAENKCYAAFTNFGAFSLDIQLIYYIKKDANIFDVQTAVNLKVLSRFNQAGLEMAFPTQTLVHQGLDLKTGDAVGRRAA